MHLRQIFQSVRSSFSTVAVLGLLAAIGLWGHLTHWSLKLPEAAAAVPVPEPLSVAVKSDRTAEGGIAFDHVDGVRLNGIASAKAEVRPFAEDVIAPAVVSYDPRKVAQLSARVAGHVHAVRTTLGQAVKRGDVLAVIDSEEVGRAKVEYLQAVAQADFRAKSLGHLRGQSSIGVLAESAIRESESQLKEAEVRRFGARQRLLNLGFHLNHDDAKAESTEALAERLHFLGLPSAVLAELTPRPATANLMPLVAPFDGVVTSQNLVAGELVRPEAVAIVVADVTTMAVKVSVREEDAVRLRPGLTAVFSANGLAAPARGTLTWVGTEIDEKTRTVPAWFAVANPEGEIAQGNGVRPLRANQFGTARIRIADHPAAPVVPADAVHRLPDQSSVVFVALTDGKSFRLTRVRVGPTQGGQCQLLDGVRPDDRIVIAGGHVLRSEMARLNEKGP